MAAHNIQVDVIWGDDPETQTFAHANDGQGAALNFRFLRDIGRPESLASRIVASFHELRVTSTSETFSDLPAMRTALGDAIRQAWPNCIHAAKVPYAVIDLDGYGEKRIDYQIRYEDALYRRFLCALLSASSQLTNDSTLRNCELINQRDLIIERRLPGRGASAAVRRSASVKPLYVLKGVDFGDSLASWDEFEHNRDMLYHTITILSKIPPHPNIMSPPRTLAVAQWPEDESRTFVSGTLYPFMEQGSLDDQIIRCNEYSDHLNLRDKARWCLQLCSALEHTHYTACTYHMDIKPANVLVDGQGNAILIDWEQNGAPLYTLAPEANGGWDVDEIAGKLVYTPYEGPKRVNITGGRPEWSVFPEWSKRWPRACEAAEVFSLGRTMWMLLNQVPQEEVEDLDPHEIIISWDKCSDIPRHWIDIVMNCMEGDPNKRIGLGGLVHFWKAQQA
jgi:hypothetical protein